jgi:phosphatidylserine decarboxylase
MGRLVSIRWPKAINNCIIRRFVAIFSINVSEAEKNIEDYSSLQEFFIRRLKANARTISLEKNAVISPCDGVMSEAGYIEHGKLLQVKGKYYGVSDLLASPELAKKFEGGYFCTIYLSPRDYHRFHVPVDGAITQTRYIPGALWPVNKWAVKNIRNLFCINERIISLIEESVTKKNIAYIAVGATMVGKIKLDYCDVENKGTKSITIEHEGQNRVKVNKGQELGRFMFGSTVVMLFEKGFISGFEKITPAAVTMGEVLAKI